MPGERTGVETNPDDVAGLTQRQRQVLRDMERFE